MSHSGASGWLAVFEELSRAGFNLLGRLVAERYDAAVPASFRSDALLPGASAALAPESARAPVYAASLLESFCAGLASAAFLSFLMRICEKEHAAVQYALLTAIYALPGSFVAVASGWLTEQVGYAAYFTATAAIALPAFAFLPRASAWIDSEPASPA